MTSHMVHGCGTSWIPEVLSPREEKAYLIVVISTARQLTMPEGSQCEIDDC